MAQTDCCSSLLCILSIFHSLQYLLLMHVLWSASKTTLQLRTLFSESAVSLSQLRPLLTVLAVLQKTTGHTVLTIYRRSVFSPVEIFPVSQLVSTESNCYEVVGADSLYHSPQLDLLEFALLSEDNKRRLQLCSLFNTKNHSGAAQQLQLVAQVVRIHDPLLPWKQTQPIFWFLDQENGCGGCSRG